MSDPVDPIVDPNPDAHRRDPAPGAPEHRTLEVATELVPGPVTVDVVRPAAVAADLPLLVWLHGGNGPDGVAEACRPALEQCWADGSLPSCTVAFPHSDRSFWLDAADGGPAWETFVSGPLIDHLQATLGVGDTTAVGGISMGGTGSLRMAFRRPDRFAAAAALEPAAHHPLTLARNHAVEIAAHGLAVYVECGDGDGFDLSHGAEALHRLLWDIGLRHEYRSVRGADHVGRSVGPRTVDALRFVGRALAHREAAATRLHDATGFRRHHTVTGPAGPIEVREEGSGPTVVMLPSLGRGATDFDDLAHRLARAGYHTVCPEPRGIGGSTGELDGLTMADLAADVVAVIHAVATGPVTLVGHAFGNRVARMTATHYPHLVDSVVLLVAGGLVPPASEHADALLRVFDVELPDEEHLAAVAQAFFAPGNDPAVWFDGWHGIVAAVQGVATREQPADHWWGAGGAEVFVVQPADDVMAVPDNAHRLCEALGDRASMVTVPNAGHALLPEQPEAVEVALRLWLTRDRFPGPGTVARAPRRAGA